MDKKVLEAFKALDKLNPEATFLSETSLSSVDDWFDTGCMVLNSILSGSLYKGIPKGRITGFSGPSMCGKTYIINKILGNAQRKGYIPVVFDTEMAVDEGNAAAVGLDPEKTKYVPFPLCISQYLVNNIGLSTHRRAREPGYPSFWYAFI
jgi:RecA/RadA recombinase